VHETTLKLLCASVADATNDDNDDGELLLLLCQRLVI